MIKLATVFSGIGDIEHALKRMGIEHEILFACDNGEREVEIDYKKEFENRVEHIVTGKLNKTDRIRLIFEQKLGKISKSDIANACPDISISMIERTLKEMLDKGEIIKDGSGRATAYVKK